MFFLRVLFSVLAWRACLRACVLAWRALCVLAAHRNEGHSVCVCESPYINLVDGERRDACVYEGVQRTVVLVASGFGGFLGIDWFILSRGTNMNFIYVGLAKLSTLGGFGVWWAYDFARIASGVMNDGNGMPLFADM